MTRGYLREICLVDWCLVLFEVVSGGCCIEFADLGSLYKWIHLGWVEKNFVLLIHCCLLRLPVCFRFFLLIFRTSR